MRKETIIRAWREPEFRESLTAEERAALPECPAGQSITELEEGELATAVGGALVAFDDLTCICSKFTGPIPTWTTFTTRQTTIQEKTILQANQLTILGG
jgi:mersacidin/lichenicidin family type 2 lantibiotic